MITIVVAVAVVAVDTLAVAAVVYGSNNNMNHQLAGVGQLLY